MSKSSQRPLAVRRCYGRRFLDHRPTHIPVFQPVMPSLTPPWTPAGSEIGGRVRAALLRLPAVQRPQVQFSLAVLGQRCFRACHLASFAFKSARPLVFCTPALITPKSFRGCRHEVSSIPGISEFVTACCELFQKY